ncbi:hypothetical protein E2562_034319 [Oryza meyeriana var. granulata]|uniref:Uncharacterized protein n=1 Tax=Oryza meyeriana var. granulata TaxID=110450 RepID=A0A6G1FF27_9ORYZ|nr:hypothetical protein E2562_034319 [Oryza meyeriana var. granulata]
MASTRVWLLAAVLVACAIATCRPGDPRAPENQEEEGGFGVRLPSMPSIPGDGDDDDELPSFDTHMTILGH